MEEKLQEAALNISRRCCRIERRSSSDL